MDRHGGVEVGFCRPHLNCNAHGLRDLATGKVREIPTETMYASLFTVYIAKLV